MGEEQIEAFKYRFSGYQLPMLQLDSTGPSYIYIPAELSHPYYSGQPRSFAKPAYKEDTSLTSSEKRAALYGRLFPLL